VLREVERLDRSRGRTTTSTSTRRVEAPDVIARRRHFNYAFFYDRVLSRRSGRHVKAADVKKLERAEKKNGRNK